MSDLDFICQPYHHSVEIKGFDGLFEEEFGCTPIRKIDFSILGDAVTFHSTKVFDDTLPEETVEITHYNISRFVQERELFIHMPECISILGFDQLIEKIAEIVISCLNGNQQEFFVVTPKTLFALEK